MEQSEMIYFVYLQIEYLKDILDMSDVRCHVQPVAEQLQPRTRR